MKFALVRKDKLPVSICAEHEIKPEYDVLKTGDYVEMDNLLIAWMAYCTWSYEHLKTQEYAVIKVIEEAAEEFKQALNEIRTSKET